MPRTVTTWRPRSRSMERQYRPGLHTHVGDRVPSVYVMVHAAGDARNTMRPPVLTAKGTAVFASNRPTRYGLAWGNYNSTCVDPSDPTILWTYQEYATSPFRPATLPAGSLSSSIDERDAERIS